MGEIGAFLNMNIGIFFALPRVRYKPHLLLSLLFEAHGWILEAPMDDSQGRASSSYFCCVSFPLTSKNKSDAPLSSNKKDVESEHG
jgi:hypothetical protein